MKKELKKNLHFGVLIGLICAITLSFARFDASCTELRHNVLRLHIIANSDSQADQCVKLLVRDSILQSTATAFDECCDLESAIIAAQEEIEAITENANSVLKANGMNYGATARIGKAYFDNREYDDFTLPAGEYTSLIVTLGEGVGKNWWCVVFPTICLPSADAASLSDSVSKNSAVVAQNPTKYVLRFKFAEWYEDFKRKF